MPNRPSYYSNGDEIRPGDRVALAGRPGRVLFVLGTAEMPADWRYLEAEHESGYMLDIAAFGLILQHDVDEDLELVARGP